MRTVVRRSLAAEDKDLAVQIGTRLRAARQRAGLTQREVAEPRYTKAYISALENGLIKPSMAALRFVATKLGTTASDLLADTDLKWQRTEAELRLAAGDWQAAIDAFQAMLDGGLGGADRGIVLTGTAEALCRLARGREAVAVASEARELLAQAGLVERRRQAAYWLASAHFQTDNPSQARLIVEDLLREVNGDPTASPDLRVRLLMSLASVHSAGGAPKQAIPLLEEARGIGADLDDRRRGSLFLSLALGYRATGDTEAAIRAAHQGLALFRAAEAQTELAVVENELALDYLALGNLGLARRHAKAARQGFERLRDEFSLANVDETEAQIALAAGHRDDARSLAATAGDRARRLANHKAEVSALLTTARADRADGRLESAAAALEAAAAAAADGPAARRREILTEWSELVAETGDHARAYQLSREALELT